jgi:hypothetical protein
MENRGRPSLAIVDTVILIREQKYCCAVCKEELLIETQWPEGTNVDRKLKAIDIEDKEALYHLPLDTLQLNHKLPRSAGGSGRENIEIVCKNCSKTSQKSVTLPDSIWKMIDDHNREIYGGKGNIGMSRGRRLREIIILHLHSLDSEE